MVGTAQLFGCGPAVFAPQNIAWFINNRDQIWLEVDKADFPGNDARAGSPSSEGSQLLQSAVFIQSCVARAVEDNGIPDGIRVFWTGRQSSSVERVAVFHLAYLDRGTVIIVDPNEHQDKSRLMPLNDPHALAQIRADHPRNTQLAVELYGPPPAPYAVRAMLDEERTEIDPELALRLGIEQLARVMRVGRTLVMQIDESTIHPSASQLSPGFSNNYITVPVTPESARMFGDTANNPGRYIAWVDPASPVAEVLEVGWRLVAINGDPPERFTPAASGDTAEYTLQRDGVTKTVTVAPERWPMAARFFVLPESNRTAFVGRSHDEVHVGIASPFLSLLTSDDLLAVALAHELGHAVQGHLTPPSTGEKAARIGWMLTAGVLMTPQLAMGIADRFDRDKERSADLMSLRLAHEAGYDATAGLALIDLFETKYDAGPEFLGSHPPYDERRGAMQSELQRLGRETPSSSPSN